ncbi:unnamed protein product, partial [Brachionus calyciflorus]
KKDKRSKELLDAKKYTGNYIGGDFNCPGVKWFDEHFSYTESSENSYENRLISTIDDCFYSQNVLTPTYQFKYGALSNTLDLILTEKSSRIFSVSSGLPLGRIDKGHLTLRWNYEVNMKYYEIFRSSNFDFRRGDYEKFDSYFNSIDWNEELKQRVETC